MTGWTKTQGLDYISGNKSMPTPTVTSYCSSIKLQMLSKLCFDF